MSSPFNGTSQQQIASAALLASSAAPAMSLFGAGPVHIDNKPHIAPDPGVMAATSYPVTAATAAAIAATLGSSPQQWGQSTQPTTAAKMLHPKSPSSMAAGDEKISAVKSGGVHKSKSSTSSVSSSSTVGGTHRRRGSGSASIDSSEREDDATEERNDGAGDANEKQKRRRFLERNRIAASKCRQKKKMWVQELERRAEDVTMQNRSLHIAVAQLKEEVLILKNQLLAHRNCNCSAIHQYLHTECASASADVTVPLSAQPPHSLMSSPPAHIHHPAPNSTVAAAAAAATGVTAAAPPLMLQPQNYGPSLPAHQNASSVDLSSIASNNPVISAAFSSADVTRPGVFGPGVLSNR
ncbi:hypothetical protein COEREDRAFT_78915 [Coemansia reversa NRRL 1564]|uniref:BZIP domain-containing protein n=1 Tax=Coemansia reversa (strain ATCC 12441 / NRRL 1564) TaxID=763665 RepID=A0A2G5BKS6_COERN|nr:hypothetical protein COEREDRAFT_78915 [Coemansia reversa NRRL 1564]|eukprot:PIA19591.1 hypothetical protein COEREDRAFT_78915 [Coemansia reversa NRRL 1564]